MNDPKVKIHTQPTPSEQIVAQAAQEITVHDAAGREIILRKPGVLAQFRLVEAVGNEAAKNEVYMGMSLPLLFVASIDGNVAPTPVTKPQLEALITRLGEDGVNTVMKAVQENFGAPDPEAAKDAIRK